MLYSRLYEMLASNGFSVKHNRISTGGPKKPKGPNNFVIFLIVVLILLGILITYNLYF